MVLSILVIILAIAKAEMKYTKYQIQEDFVPIFGYHQISDETTSTKITYEKFHEQIKYFTEEFGCNWITMHNLAQHIQNGEKLPTNACVMNFDDGAASQLFSMCSLNKYKIPATFYVIPGQYGNETHYINNEDWITRNIELDGIDKHDYYMYPQEVKLIHSWGHDIQTHTMTQPDLSSLSYEDQWDEIYNSIITLKEEGYEISSLAYPFGNFNEDTLKIMEELFEQELLVLGRDTEKNEYFREPRAAVFNVSLKYAYNYIKPEELTIEELEKKVKYTGWWQFEENYKLYNESYDIWNKQKDKVSANPTFTPIQDFEDSYAILAIYEQQTIVETTFATKYKSGVSIDIFSHHDGSGVGYIVEVEGEFYTPIKHDEDSEFYLESKPFWTSSSGEINESPYYNYYIDIDNLDGGIHTMRIHKLDGKKVYLDKFRIFANVDQTFSEKSAYYYNCIDDDPNCNCDYNERTNTNNNWKLYLTEMEMVIIVCVIVIVVSFCLCLNTGSNREFKKYGHIEKQREKFLQKQLEELPNRY